MHTVEVTRYTYHLFSSRDEDAVVVFLYDDKNDVVGEGEAQAPAPQGLRRTG